MSTVKRAERNQVNVFRQILDDAQRKGQVPQRTVESIEWFKNYIRKNLYRVNNPFANADNAQIRKWPRVGKMYVFKYQAKTADKLPYWDAMPLTLFFNEDSETLIGFNFHYLPIQYRVAVLGKLWEILGNRWLDKNARITATYQILQRMAISRFLGPAIKRYRKDHVRSRFLEIPPSQWGIAMFLPIARFQKASQQKVHYDYRNKINGRK